MEKVHVREANPADVEAIASIHIAAWRASYRGILPQSLLEGLRVDDRTALWAGYGVHTLVACRGVQTIGFTRLCPAHPISFPPFHSGEVSHLYLDPSELGKGVGRLLFESALRIARDSGYAAAVLWVLEENLPARRFYESFGLVPDGARRTDPEFLGNLAVEIRYWIPLTSPIAGEGH